MAANQAKGCYGQCQHFMQKKKRLCKFLAIDSRKFCAEHLPRDSKTGEYELNGKRRVPCPLDPKHTVFESKLQSHLRKCNAKPVNPGAHFVKDVNLGDGSEPQSRLLADVPIDELQSLIKRIESLYDKFVNLKMSITEHKVLESDLNNPEHQSCLKHRKQEASLLGNMDKQGWIVDGTTFVEFGAGRARLATYLMEAASSQDNSHFILIDRDHARNKCENKFKDNSSGPSFERLRIDIKDLNLADVEAVRERKDNPLVAYSKHLCGCATDLTLRCLESCSSPISTESPSDPEASAEKRSKLSGCCVKGIQIALCCHHRCTWRMYYGKQFWKENNLTTDDFVIVRALTGWATCAFPDKAHHNDGLSPESEPNHDDRYLGMDRETIGIKSTRLLDYGRLDALNRLGYQAHLVTYTTPEVSLENVMLVASPLPLHFQAL